MFDVNAKDNSGRTPLDMAAQHGRMDVIELLVARGADMDAKDKAGLMALKEAEKKVQTRSSSSGHEYEVDGLVNQTMIQFNGTNLHASASFTVYVRDCGWMIATTETNEAEASSSGKSVPRTERKSMNARMDLVVLGR